MSPQSALKAACNDDGNYPPNGTVPINVDGLIVLGTPSDDAATIKSISAQNHKILDHLISPEHNSLHTVSSWGVDLSNWLRAYTSTCNVGFAAPHDLNVSLYFDFKGVPMSQSCPNLSTILAAYGIQLVNGHDEGKLIDDAVSAFLHSKHRAVLAFTRGVQPQSAYSAQILFSMGGDSPCALPVVVRAQGQPYFVPRDDPFGLLGQRVQVLTVPPGTYYIAPAKLLGTGKPVPKATSSVRSRSAIRFAVIRAICASTAARIGPFHVNRETDATRSRYS